MILIESQKRTSECRHRANAFLGSIVRSMAPAAIEKTVQPISRKLFVVAQLTGWFREPLSIFCDDKFRNSRTDRRIIGGQGCPESVLLGCY